MLYNQNGYYNVLHCPQYVNTSLSSKYESKFSSLIKIKKVLLFLVKHYIIKMDIFKY